jgi:uncharacterized protein (TIGR00255 family)
MAYGFWSWVFEEPIQPRPKTKEQQTMKSMTGYGKGTVNGDDFSVSVDLKTVNNRFLDIHLRVGSELSAIEPSIKRRISSRLSRGRVDVTVSLEAHFTGRLRIESSTHLGLRKRS